MLRGFIPITKKETDDLGWKKVDVVIVTGDAYIDHPYFISSSAGRFLNSKGIRTAILDMPDINSEDDWNRFGKPNLFFLVITGTEDSMVSNYSAFRKFRTTDPFAPGGERNHRPDRALIKYCNKIKQLYKDSPIIISGAEAAGRMSTHYDHWSEKLRKPILFDSKADMLLFGTIELNLVKIGQLIKSGNKISEIRKLRSIAYIEKDIDSIKNTDELPDHENIIDNPGLLVEHHMILHRNQNPFNTKVMVQKVMNRYLVIHKPSFPLDKSETDEIFNTGFLKRQHPKYKKVIPVFKLFRDSVLTHRGCLNDMSVSQNVFTEGRMISSRSTFYIKREAVRRTQAKDFKKIIKIFGYPFFNQYGITPKNEKKCMKCDRLSCTYPDVCSNLTQSGNTITKLMYEVDQTSNLRNNYYASEPDIKLLLNDKNLLKDYINKRNDGNIDQMISSSSDEVRKLMGLDPSEGSGSSINTFIKRAGEYGKKINFKISFMSGYPGQDEEEVKKNIEFTENSKVEIGLIHNFIPLPSTLASVQYFLGIDHFSGKTINVEKKLGVNKKLAGLYTKSKSKKEYKTKKSR